MGDLKKIEHKGKSYKTGAVYMFNVEGAWFPDILRGISESGEFNGDLLTGSMLQEIYSAGEIEDAPLELEDGEWYMCEYSISGHLVIGALIYCEGSGFKSSLRMPTVNSADPLYKMVKA